MYLREIEVTLIIEDSTCLSNAINDDLYRVITNLQDGEAIMILINIDISLFKIESGLRKELKFSEKNKLTKAIKIIVMKNIIWTDLKYSSKSFLEIVPALSLAICLPFKVVQPKSKIKIIA